ncbi:MAG: dihydrolipoamide acetyltransferase family protein [Nitrospirota bacterium]|nr:dihydrolipoamide acetyltransferase family protein [Nitrospirota bacterium]
MEKTFYFPDVGEGIAEGEVVQWLVKIGDLVKEDQAVVEVETDKAVVSLPSPFSGKITEIQAASGEIIPVGAALFTVETEVASAETGKTSPSTETLTPQEMSSKRDGGSVVGVLKESDEEFVLPPGLNAPIKQDKPKTRAIPSVRMLAKKLGVDLSLLQGSGPAGRIMRDDIEQAATAQADKTREKQESATKEDHTSLGTIERIPFRGVRRSAARRVMQSSKTVAPVTFVDDADITKLERVRLAKKDMTEEKGFKLTYLPFIIKSVVAGLKTYPFLNASLDEAKKEVILKKYYNIGIAVDTPEGLMVFVLKNADQKSILDLAEEISQLTEKAYTRTITLSELKGGTFTLTNYGVIGGIYGTPIINYPEVGILGLGKIEDKAVVRNGEIVIRKMLPLSLTFDHRVIYGAESARFMNTVIEHLEDPDLLLVTGK